MGDKEFQEKAEDLTTKAEQGDKNALQNELHKMSPQEQLSMVEEMNKINAERRKVDSSLPDLQFTTHEGPGGKHLDNIEMVKGERSWINPKRLLGNKYDSQVDVYDPKIDLAGTGLLDNMGKSIAGNRGELAKALKAAGGQDN